MHMLYRIRSTRNHWTTLCKKDMANSMMKLPGSLRCCISQSLARSAPRQSITTTAKHIIPASPKKTSSTQLKGFHSSAPTAYVSRAPKSKDRGPPSKEDTQTDFAAMNILGNTPAPTTGIDACQYDGFALNNGTKVVGSGVLLVGGESFRWRPWIREGRREGTIGEGAKGDDDKGVGSQGGKLLNAKGQFDIDDQSWGVLEVVWPKPDLLILGTGGSIAPVSPATRQRLTDLGIRLEIQDTRNAASQFNLLATERGVQQVAAALVPIGWREGQ